MQSEIANLAGSLDGRGNIQLGAATDGPSSTANFVGLRSVSTTRRCSAGHYSAGYRSDILAECSARILLSFARSASTSSATAPGCWLTASPSAAQATSARGSATSSR
jgi:hypothetical protein